MVTYKLVDVNEILTQPLIIQIRQEQITTPANIIPPIIATYIII